MKTKVAVAIREEANDCLKTALDERNTAENRNIFHTVGIILTGLANKLDKQSAGIEEGTEVKTDLSEKDLDPTPE